MIDKITLSVPEAAEALGLSRPTLYKLIHRDDFPVVKVGTRTLIPKRGLEDWVASQTKGKNSKEESDG